MKLDKTLNFKKVRCVKGYDDCLEIGKEYNVIDISVEIKVKDDRGELLYWESDYFEPVLADNSINIQDIGTDILDTNADIKDTPKFKIGSGFYFGLNSKIYIVKKCTDNEIFANDPYDPIELLSLRKIHCCPATPENYERLQATFPDIEFEQPPKELAGTDLAKALIEKGWVGFNCLCGHSGDENAITDTIVTGINNDGQFTTIDGRLFSNAIPMKGWRPLQAREVGL
nr:hypothetical protein [Moraxella sp. CTOTU48717]